MSVLEARNISKQYPGTLALDNVTVTFDSGRVHALIGKNGSGKSTLLNVLAGATSATNGEILLDGVPVQFNSPIEAMEQGIATVYQELSLIPGLSVAENILMNRIPHHGIFIDWKKTYDTAQKMLDDMDIRVKATELVSSLSVWQCQMVEIAKAMSSNPKVLQLDEPTSSLAQSEVQLLFKLIQNLKNKGVIIVYVSHKLHELWEIADTCTVLRDGKFIASKEMQGLKQRELINMMFGEIEIKTLPKDLLAGKETVLDVEHLSDGKKFSNVSFALHKGEVLGIAGMLGSGRTELLNSIFGADVPKSGRIILNGKEVKQHSPAVMKSKGFAMTQEDRKMLGLNLNGSIADNLCYASIDNMGKGIFVEKAIADQLVTKQVNDLQIKVADPNYAVSSLSGGNQQKVVVGNWLNTHPAIMLFDEPSRGIDVSAKQQIFQIIWDQSRQGVSSIIVSSELEELLEVCHRILILRGGHIVKEVFPEDLKIDDLYALCMGEE